MNLAMYIDMSVSNVSSTNGVKASTDNEVNPNLEVYNSLNVKWSVYNSNANLSTDFKKKINESLEKLKELIDTNKEEENNEEIAQIIANLTAIIDGSDKMISIADRVACLADLKRCKGIDVSDESDTEIDNKLNSIDDTYISKEAFYKDLCFGILSQYSGRIDETTNTAIKTSITEGQYTSLESFYKDLFIKVLENQKDNIKKNDFDSMQATINSATGYTSAKDFFTALTQSLISYAVYQSDQGNISALSRTNLSNNTLSLKVIQASNAHKMLELDNYMSEALNKRAEMDPAMKRLRDGNYWGDNNQIKASEDVKKEDELWTKKQE